MSSGTYQDLLTDPERRALLEDISAHRIYAKEIFVMLLRKIEERERCGKDADRSELQRIVRPAGTRVLFDDDQRFF